MIWKGHGVSIFAWPEGGGVIWSIFSELNYLYGGEMPKLWKKECDLASREPADVELYLTP